MWLNNLIGIENYGIISANNNLIDKDKLLYKNFKQRYAKVYILKNNEFKNCGIKTVDREFFKSYSNYFVIETTAPLSANFEYGYANSNSKMYNFDIPAGRHIYQTFIDGRLLVKRKDALSKPTIVGTDVKKFKIEKHRMGKHKEDKKLRYREYFRREEENIGKWIEPKWYFNDWFSRSKYYEGDLDESIKVGANDIYAIGVYTTPGYVIYSKVKLYNRKSYKYENWSEPILIEPFINTSNETEFLLRKCYTFPSGKLFLKCTYQGKLRNKLDRAGYVDIYEQTNPFENQGLGDK